MIDLRLLRDDPEMFADLMGRRGIDRDAVARIADLDECRRALVTQVDSLRAEQNARSRAIGTAPADERQGLIVAAAELKEPLRLAEEELDELASDLGEALAGVPNLPHPDAPVGGEDDSIEVRRVGEPPRFDFEVRDHVELMEPVGALDIARAAKVSGSRFYYLKGEGALLEFALVRYALDVAMEHGYVPVIPPVLVRREAMFGTGFLPTDEQQIFATRDDDLYLVGTAEVPLAGLHLDEVIDVPTRYAGFSTCFRREAGTYGRDTRGMFRVHQFDKVELFSFVTPEESSDEHERILAIEEQIVAGLGLHYRVVDIAVGDLGASAARKFDIESWLPGQQAYRELTSCSNTTDYQARRLRVRTRGAAGPRGGGGHTARLTARGPAQNEESDVVEQEKDPFTRAADRGYRVVENVVYALVAVLLIVCAGALLISTANELVTGITEGARETVEHVLDSLLLVFILVELLGATRASLISRTLVAEPFLLVGIIASIKEIVVIGAGVAPGDDPSEFAQSMVEIGVLAAVLLVLAVAMLLVRRKEREPGE
ncbi:MAG: serine--tRNA ligase [Actinobacteria bacterium]|nr:serine--tRNA ligase [Actinomycetota bacterium]